MKKITSLLLTLIMVFTLTGTTAFAITNGFATKNGKTYYYKSNKKVTGTKWITYKNKKYYLKKSVVQKKKFLIVKSKKYRFNKKGILQLKKWVKVGGKVYRANNKGVILRNKKNVKIGDKYWNFDKNGVRSAGKSPKPPTESPATNAQLEVIRKELIRLTKEKNSGLNFTDPLLLKAADIRASELIEEYSHTRPNGTSYATVFDDVGYIGHPDFGYTSAENLAGTLRDKFGYTNKELKDVAKYFFDGWWESEGHRKNIVNTSYEKCGIGVFIGYEQLNNGTWNISINAIQLFTRESL